MMEFFSNATLGVCWWDLPALILLIALTTGFFIKRNKLKKELKDLKSGLVK